MHIRSATVVLTAALAASAVSVPAQTGGMKMAMPEKPAHFAVTRQAYTTNHDFLVKLLSVPQPIPFEKYFTLRFAVYDGGNPSERVSDAKVTVLAGMRHGMETGFAHGMESSPKIRERDGIVTVSGMYFHMMGPWTLKTTIHSGGKSGVAYFQLPCCAQ